MLTEYFSHQAHGTMAVVSLLFFVLLFGVACFKIFLKKEKHVQKKLQHLPLEEEQSWKRK